MELSSGDAPGIIMNKSKKRPGGIDVWTAAARGDVGKLQAWVEYDPALASTLRFYDG